MINTDASVSNLKGVDRPINPWGKRVTDIWSFVDREIWHRGLTELKFEIEPFNNDYELLKSFRRFLPHMIVKGSDRPDTRTITGFNEFPILIVPRLCDKEGLVYSTTRQIKNE